MPRILLITLDVLPSNTISWWNLFDELFKDVFNINHLNSNQIQSDDLESDYHSVTVSDYQIDLIDLLPHSHPFYTVGNGVPLSPINDNNEIRAAFEPGIKMTRNVDLRQMSKNSKFPGCYFPCDTADEAINVIENENLKTKQQYDLIVFPGSRLTCYLPESDQIRETLRQILVKKIAPNEKTKLIGICFGFQLFAEVLSGQLPIGSVCKPNPSGFFMEYSIRGNYKSELNDLKLNPDLKKIQDTMPELFYVHGDFVEAQVQQISDSESELEDSESQIRKLEVAPIPVAKEFRDLVGDELIITNVNPHIVSNPVIRSESNDPHKWIKEFKENLVNHDNSRIPDSESESDKKTVCHSDSKPSLWIAESFISSNRNVFACQGHPEISSKSFYDTMVRCANKKNIGLNGYALLPEPHEISIVDDNMDSLSCLNMYSFPVMPNEINIVGSENCSSRFKSRKLVGDTARLPGVREWLKTVLNTMKVKSM